MKGRPIRLEVGVQPELGPGEAPSWPASGAASAWFTVIGSLAQWEGWVELEGRWEVKWA